jgi:hypothetical protein
MTVPIWPSDLPQKFLANGYSEKLRDGRIFVRTGTGPGKARRRFSSAVIPVNGSMYLRSDQKARFERFWNEDTNGGVLAFNIPDQTHDGFSILNDEGLFLTTDAGEPLIVTAKWLAMFAQEPPTFTTINGGYFSVSFGLSVLP